MNGGKPTYSDNLSGVPSWVYRVDSPPEVDDEPWPVQLAATRHRDGWALALAVLVIVALAGYAIGRAS